jgi:VanZ family protein
VVRHALLWLPVVAYMAVVFHLSSESDPLPQLTAVVWDKALHFVEYAGLAVLLARAFLGEGVSPRQVLFIAVGVASLYAVTDETHQIWVQGRDPAFRDWLAGSLGAIGGAGFYVAVITYVGRRP